MTYAKTKIAFLIAEYVNGFKAERNRQILSDRFITGMTYEALADKHSMSVSQIGRIVHKYGDPIMLMLAKETDGK